MAPIDPDIERELKRIDRRVESLETMPEVVAVNKETMVGIRGDLAELKRCVDDRATERKQERKERDEQRERERKERKLQQKSTRRWIVGTVLSSAGLVIAAMAVLLNALGGGT